MILSIRTSKRIAQKTSRLWSLKCIFKEVNFEEDTTIKRSYPENVFVKLNFDIAVEQ